MIFDKLLKLKRKENQVIWGIRVPKVVKMRWLLLSSLMRVPCNRLIVYVLQDWVRQNAEMLIDGEARNHLADRITEAYLNDKLV